MERKEEEEEEEEGCVHCKLNNLGPTVSVNVHENWTLAKQYEIKSEVQWGTSLGNNLGTWEPHGNTLSTKEKKRDKIPSSLDTSWVMSECWAPSHWLHETFISKTECHYHLWPGLMAGENKLWDTLVHCGTLSHAQNLHMLFTVENCFMQQHLYREAFNGTIAHHICNNTKLNLSCVNREL